MALDNLLADSKPQSRALWLFRQRFARLGEPFKDVRQALGRDTDAGVGDTHHRPLPIRELKAGQHLLGGQVRPVNERDRASGAQRAVMNVQTPASHINVAPLGELYRIEEQVSHYLDEPVVVAVDRRQPIGR